MAIPLERPAAKGRTASSVSVSLMPSERAELEELTARTGIGATTLHQLLVSPKIKAAVWMLRELEATGVAIDPSQLPETTWFTAITEDEVTDLYSGSKNIGYPG
ncbi:MAG: hypothetical protein WCJ73_04800 [Actinomycetes bacterium]|jgi:hypothetical protein